MYFSIVIPAHNEEKYIEETLSHIKNLNYPADQFEALVVENGSADRTFEVAGKFAGQNIKIFSSAEKGVSKARNFGAGKIRPDSDWTVFLDADTLLKSEFLNDLNNFLIKNQAKNYAVGTTSLEPVPKTFYAKCWFVFYDIGHWITRASYSIQILKSSLLKDIKYDEEMTTAEDLKLIKDALKYGKFFFVKTPTVFTSTRRFTETGWFKLFFIWTFVASLPVPWQKKFSYKVTR